MIPPLHSKVFLMTPPFEAIFFRLTPSPKSHQPPPTPIKNERSLMSVRKAQGSSEVLYLNGKKKKP